MALQPYDTDEKLYYPSGQQPLLAGIYDVNSLTPAGPRLYGFNVGDFAYPSLTPIPHVEMTIFGLNPNTVTITVTRTVKGRTMVVPGQIRGYAVGGRNVVDWDAPFGVPLSYRAEQFDIDGNSLGFTVPFTTQLDVESTWIQNAFDPRHAVPVTMASGAGATLSRPTPTDVYYPVGSGLGVGISGQRKGLTDVPVPFLTFSELDADKVRGMFGDPYTSPSVPPVVVIRTGAGQNLRLPQPFYALIQDAGETPMDTNIGGHITRWECTAIEVARPAPALVAAVLSYADLDAAYPTYSAMDAAYDSYLARDRDYSLAGTAGTETP
jgi:hypothetical protein